MHTGANWLKGLVFATGMAVAMPALAEAGKVKADIGQAGTADKEAKEKARAHMKAGVNYANDPSGAKWEEALGEFRKAYSYVPSWLIAGNIGTAALHVERDQEALEYYTKYLAEGGKRIKAEERKQVEADVATLKASMVRVSVTTDMPGVTLVDERMATDGKTIVNRYPAESSGTTELGIHPGNHRMVAKLGDKQATWEFTAESGATLTHEFKLAEKTEGAGLGKSQEAPPAAADRAMEKPASARDHATPTAGAPGERPTPTSVYVGLVGTGVLAAGAVVTGMMALDQHSQFDDQNRTAGGNSAELQDLKDTGQLLSLVTDVLIGAAVVGAGVTTYLYVTRPEAPAEQPHASLRILPAVSPRGGGVTVLGRF
jgi:hypothetical protein